MSIAFSQATNSLLEIVDIDTNLILINTDDSIGIESAYLNTKTSDSLPITIKKETALSNYKHWRTNEIIYKQDITPPNFDSVQIVLIDSTNKQFYSHPFAGPITSHFGYRRYRQHYGTDIDLIKGDSVHIAFDGKVRYTKYAGGFGKVVVIRHTNGLETVYAHLSKILVDSNQIVKAGEILGLGGNTGRSTGSHLHFEVRYLGRALDPENIIDIKKGKIINDTIFITENSFHYLQRIAADKYAKFHYVRSGDTLSAISRRYHTRVSKLCYYNGIKQTAVLQIGQRIRVK